MSQPVNPVITLVYRGDFSPLFILYFRVSRLPMLGIRVYCNPLWQRIFTSRFLSAIAGQSGSRNRGSTILDFSRNLDNIYMKENIHPKYYPEAKVQCACGNHFTVGSTRAELKVEICSKCHPFYTGEEKLMDIAGRVEKFKARRTKAAAAPKIKKIRIKKTPTR